MRKRTVKNPAKKGTRTATGFAKAVSAVLKSITGPQVTSSKTTTKKSEKLRIGFADKLSPKKAVKKSK